MKAKILGMTITIICICLLPIPGLSCTTLVLDNNGQPIYGKNFDYNPVSSYVVVNKRGLAKTTIPTNSTDKLIEWTSRFGSITFTYAMREWPFEGMNEAGLFVSSMGLFDINESPGADSRLLIHPFRWVQYQLDNCSTVDEVLASDQIIKVPQPPPDSKEMGIHYLVSDSKGKTAIIEWIDKKMVVHTGDTLPVKVLTNTTYDQSLEVLSNFKGFGGSWPIPPGLFWVYFSKDTHSYLRFIRAAELVKDFDPKTSGPAVDYALSSLRKVSMRPISGRSRWRSVYDPTNKRIYFNSFDDQEVRYFNTDAFDYSCTTPAKALDVNAKLSGDVTSNFVDYTQDMSRDMLEHSWPPIDKEEIDRAFTYPEQYTHCTE